MRTLAKYIPAGRKLIFICSDGVYSNDFIEFIDFTKGTFFITVGITNSIQYNMYYTYSTKMIIIKKKITFHYIYILYILYIYIYIYIYIYYIYIYIYIYILHIYY